MLVKYILRILAHSSLRRLWWIGLRLLLLFFLFFLLTEVITKVVINKQTIIFLSFLSRRCQGHIVIVVVFSRLLRLFLACFIKGRLLVPGIVLIVIIVYILNNSGLLIHSIGLQDSGRTHCCFRLSICCTIFLYEFLLLFSILFIAWIQTWMKLLYELHDLPNKPLKYFIYLLSVWQSFMDWSRCAPWRRVRQWFWQYQRSPSSQAWIHGRTSGASLSADKR